MVNINTPLKIVIGILILFVVLIILSFSSLKPEGNGMKESRTIIKEKTIYEEGSCLAKCNGDDECIHACNLIIQNEATKVKDPKLCNDIIVKEDKAECTRVVNMILAEELEDCMNDAVCKDRYYLRQTIGTKDKSYCENIVDSETKEVCLNV